jgi:lipopolysaccharide export system protein LptA
MLKRFLIISIFLALFAALTAHAQEAEKKIAGPITITSGTLTNDSQHHTALFEKSVVARTTDMTLYADRMLVYYKEQGGDVTRIDATGNVKVYKGTHLITSEAAVYYAEEDKVVLTGNPRAVDGDNVVTGSVMTYYVKDDRSVVEHSKVILKNKSGK